MSFFRLRMKLWVVLFAVGMTVSGLNNLSNSIRYRSPSRITYSEFIKQNPQVGWFQVTDGYLDLASAILPPASSDVDGYYVPMRSNGDTSGADPSVYVLITDNTTVRQIDALNDAARKPITRWALLHPSQLGNPPPSTTLLGDVFGMVSPRPDSDHRSSATDPSADDVSGIILFDKDAQPSAIVGILKIFAGCGLTLVALSLFGIRISPNGVKEYLQDRKAARAPDLLNGARPQYNQGQQTFRYGQSGHAPPPYPPAPQSGYTMPSYSIPPQPVPPTHHAPGPGWQQVPTAPQSTSATSVDPPAMQPNKPDGPRDREAEEIERLRNMKAFDPFA